MAEIWNSNLLVLRYFAKLGRKQGRTVEQKLCGNIHVKRDLSLGQGIDLNQCASVLNGATGITLAVNPRPTSCKSSTPDCRSINEQDYRSEMPRRCPTAVKYSKKAREFPSKLRKSQIRGWNFKKKSVDPRQLLMNQEAARQAASREPAYSHARIKETNATLDATQREGCVVALAGDSHVDRLSDQHTDCLRREDNSAVAEVKAEIFDEPFQPTVKIEEESGDEFMHSPWATVVGERGEEKHVSLSRDDRPEEEVARFQVDASVGAESTFDVKNVRTESERVPLMGTISATAYEAARQSAERDCFPYVTLSNGRKGCVECADCGGRNVKLVQLS